MAQKLRENYKLRVEQDVVETASSSGSIMKRPNAVSAYQRMFQRIPELPIHLRGKGDAAFTKNVMLISYVGLAVAVGSIAMMASGSLKKS